MKHSTLFSPPLRTSLASMSHVGTIPCGGCGKSILGMDEKYNCDGRVYHRECCKCKDCGLQLTDTTFRKSTDYLEESFVLCQKHYDERFRGRNLTKKGMWKRSGDGPPDKQQGAGPATKRPSVSPSTSNPVLSAAAETVLNKRESRSLFAQSDPTPAAKGDSDFVSKPASSSEVGTSFLDDYASTQPAKKNSESIAPMEKQGEPVKVVQAFDDGLNICLNYEFDPASKRFAYQVKNEKGESFRTAIDTFDNTTTFTTKISEKVTLIALVSHEVPNQYTFQVKNDRYGVLKLNMDFSESANVRSVLGGSLGMVSCSAIGNGRVTDVCSLVKIDDSSPPLIFAVFSIPKDLNQDLNRPRVVRSIMDETEITASRELSNQNFSVLTKGDLPLVGGRSVSHSIDKVEAGIVRYSAYIS